MFAVFLALLFALFNFGLIDLVTAVTPLDPGDTPAKVLDMGWGIVFCVLLPVPLLAALRRPLAVRHILVITVAMAFSAAASLAPGYAVVVAVLVVAVVLLWRPAPRERRVRPVLAGLALVGAEPACLYAWDMAAAARASLPPSDAESNGLHHWPIMATMALALVALVLQAALVPDYGRLPTSLAGLGALLFGGSCVAYPEFPASVGALGGWLVIAWGLLVIAAAEFKPVEEGVQTRPAPSA
ncbi:hypothetical protein ACFLIM_44110 [Nonomuraea sp. M3C6]|uniref:DUF4386 family protein n=1 Tax=Nonomuraea marmarensis TaxID=3351344 RepID=A0ABW7ARX9_9ACTN